MAARKNKVSRKDKGMKALVSRLKLPSSSVSIGLHAAEAALPKRVPKKPKKKAAKAPEPAT